jgi:quercetin dioxygenase-like cupin family protein
MIEKKVPFISLDEKVIEKLVDDDNVVINHMLLPKDTGLPEHYSNSNVYMIIVRGAMTIQLNEENANIHEKGTILQIPYQTKMNVNNFNDEMLEFFVVKAPNPKDMIK